MAFNRTTGLFQLCYNMPAFEPSTWTPTGNPATTPTAQTTEIYHNPAVFYNGAAKVLTTPNAVATVSGNIISVVPSSSAAASGGEVCVVVTRPN